VIALPVSAPTRRANGRLNDEMQRTHYTTMTGWQHRPVVARACTNVRPITTITTSAIAANAAVPAAHAAWRNAASAAAVVAAKRTARHLGPHTT